MNTNKGNAQSLAGSLEPLLASCYPVSLPSEYRYAHLALAVIDTVFSLGARYESTRATVLRFAQSVRLKPFRESVDTWLARSEQVPLTDLVTMYQQRGIEDMASDVYRNRQRTSTHASAITKAEAVFRAAEVLLAYQVNYFQDIPRVMSDPGFESDFRSIPGQGPGTGLAYFWMLTGSEMHIKPDRMVRRFIERATGFQALSAVDAQHLVEDAVERLQPRFPNLTPRQADYVIWENERSRQTRGGEGQR